ncbi:MAG: alpha/beta fold hydrolase [Bacteroidota bacterium]
MLNRKPKIIAIPFAGGNRYSFTEIDKQLSKNYEWITLELPGRGNRFVEPLLNDIASMVDDLFDKIKIHIIDCDYILYGHSMGTLLGYELVKKIIGANLRRPVCLFFTGRGAPGHSRFVSKKSILAQEPFWKEIKKMGGMPEDFFEQTDLLDLYYPILRHDFEAVENYIHSPQETPFTIPLYILMGADEIGIKDEKTQVEHVRAWAVETKASFNFEILPGDHFFILEQPEIVARKINEAFEECKEEKVELLQ